MKLTLSLIAALGLCAPALAQDAAKPAPKSPAAKPEAAQPADDPMMKAWLAASTPNEHHKLLDTFVGAWDVDVTSEMDPSKPAEHTKGETIQRWVLDGRFVMQEHSGTMMGMPFKGLGLMGYDNVEKRYIGVWGDTTGTGLMSSEGQYDAATKTWTMLGSMKDPMGNTIKTRQVIKVLSNDQHTFELFMVGPDGKDAKAMTIAYKRKEMPKFEVKPIEIRPAKPPAATPAEAPKK